MALRNLAKPVTPLILIVDDNSAVREVLKTILTRAGYETALASGGAAAMKILEASPVGLALVDIEMPEMSGYDLCAYIKTHPVWRALPVILMTGRAVAGVPQQAQTVGAVAMIGKPFEREALLRCIRENVRS